MLRRREEIAILPPADPDAPYRIREAKRQDIASVTALWEAMMAFHGERDPRFRFTVNAPREFERHLTAVLRSFSAKVYVAEAEGQVVGYILGEMHQRKPIYPVGNYGFISDISVQEAWRRHGIGQALVGTLMRWFRHEGATVIELFVSTANPVSTAFWEKMGFGDYLRLLRFDMPKTKEERP